MSTVHVRGKTSADLDFALRQLKRKVKKAGIMGELKAKRAYTKPGQARRYKRRHAQKREAQAL